MTLGSCHTPCDASPGNIEDVIWRRLLSCQRDAEWFGWRSCCCLIPACILINITSSLARQIIPRLSPPPAQQLCLSSQSSHFLITPKRGILREINCIPWNAGSLLPVWAPATPLAQGSISLTRVKRRGGCQGGGERWNRDAGWGDDEGFSGICCSSAAPERPPDPTARPPEFPRGRPLWVFGGPRCHGNGAEWDAPHSAAGAPSLVVYFRAFQWNNSKGNTRKPQLYTSVSNRFPHRWQILKKLFSMFYVSTVQSLFLDV